MKLLKRKPRTFDIQVQDLVLHITASAELNEESRAAALSFWEQLHAYTLRNPAIRSSKRPIEMPEDAPEIVREIVAASSRAGVGPMFSLRGAVTDHVGRFLARDLRDVTVGCGGDFFIVARKRQKLRVHARPDGGGIALVVPPSKSGVGVVTALGQARQALDGLGVVAESCMLADAAAAGVQAIVPKQDGFRLALTYLRRIPGVRGGVIVQGERIGLAGSVEIAG